MQRYLSLLPVSLLPVLAVLALHGLVTTQSVPGGFVVDTLASTGLSAPIDFCFLPDGRALIANRAGAVQVHAGSGIVLVGMVPGVETGAERALLSIAADPNFPANGYIYVYYSSVSDAFMHLDRFTCTGDLADPRSTNLTFAAASRREILGAIPDAAFYHNGGSTRFGPDGMLYQTVGDDGGYCSAQNVGSSTGCLLRMNVSLLPAGPSSVLPTFSSLDPGTNPLSANADFSQLVIAHGLRNPVRMDIDQLTGNVYIADVGQAGVEEYDEYVYRTPLVLENFGWPWREGHNNNVSCTGSMPALTAPIATVLHSNGWMAILGGPRYRNQGGPYDFGPAYEGSAFYHDYFAGQLRRLVDTGTRGPAPAVPGQPNATSWGTGFVGVTSMRQGPDGGLWYTRLLGTGGSLERIRKQGPDSLTVISGSSQRAVAAEAFPSPLVAQVQNQVGQPVPGAPVHFSISGPGTLSTTNPVLAGSNGLAQTTVTATDAGGSITVTASTPGATTNVVFTLFSRKLSVRGSATSFTLSITNQTAAVPTTVPYVVMVGFPGVPTWNSWFGPVCTDPSSYFTVVVEDGFGIYGGVSLSGTGGIGNPGLKKTYNIPAGLLTGLQLKFTAVGFDAVDGLFRTSCETRRF